MNTHFSQQALLDWLRPDSGWCTDHALFSTYSADPGVIASLLLSLAGFEDDPSEPDGCATKVAFAKSVVRLRKRVTIVLQAGRLFVPRGAGRPFALLDRFLKHISYDERSKAGGSDETSKVGRSWHAKCAAVRYVCETSEIGKWRFWLGSRNLTRDNSWDLGLSLEGQESGGEAQTGENIPSIADAVGKLAEAADRSDQ